LPKYTCNFYSHEIVELKSLNSKISDSCLNKHKKINSNEIKVMFFLVKYLFFIKNQNKNNKQDFVYMHVHNIFISQLP